MQCVVLGCRHDTGTSSNPHSSGGHADGANSDTKSIDELRIAAAEVFFSIRYQVGVV
jgi:hypothetical protein